MSAAPRPASSGVDPAGFDADDDFSVGAPGGSAFSFPDAPAPAAADPQAQILKPFDPALDPELDGEAESPPPPPLAAESGRPNPFAGLPSPPEPPVDEAPGFNPVGALQGHVESAMGETPVPRIAIHVFAQRPETAAIAERAAGDRRLARATTLVRPGGLADALDHYRNTPTPSLLMI